MSFSASDSSLPVIAIDGPAASGKGTLARRLADALGFALLDTGLLYRAVGLKTVQMGGNPADPAASIPVAQNLDVRGLADDLPLRTDEAGQFASQCSSIPEVRAALLDFQRQFASTPPDGKAGAILDGRDIGTVICPAADVKLYVTASAEVRAERRMKELAARGKSLPFEAVLADIKARDDRDMNRATAPLKPAADAILLDTSAMTPDEVFATALALIRKKLL